MKRSRQTRMTMVERVFVALGKARVRSVESTQIALTSGHIVHVTAFPLGRVPDARRRNPNPTEKDIYVSMPHMTDVADSVSVINTVALLELLSAYNERSAP